MKDTDIYKLIEKEEARQKEGVNLIASENYVSDDVREALGSVFTNKYAEGYPNARYYGGNDVVDEVETLCQKRALDLFDLDSQEWHMNVQALSGTPANIAVYASVIDIGDSFMGMNLSDGGHLSHGHKVSFTGKAWKQIPYGVACDTELIDYEALLQQAQETRPKLITAGFTAYPRVIDWEAFKNIADSVDAHLHVDMSHIGGLVAGGVYPSPFEYADTVMTTTHKTLRGPRSALIFSRIDDRKLHERVDKMVFPGLQGGPHVNQIAAVAVALKEAQDVSFKKYTQQVVGNAQALGDALGEHGWRIVTGGTDTHLLLVDVWNDGKGITGRDAEERLEQAGIIVNKNTIPFDTRTPFNPSGIRLGTAAETTRGKTEDDMKDIAQKIDAVLRA